MPVAGKLHPGIQYGSGDEIIDNYTVAITVLKAVLLQCAAQKANEDCEYHSEATSSFSGMIAP